MRTPSLALALALLSSACSSRDSRAAADSALNSDLSLAAQQAPPALAISDTALTPVSAPAPTPVAQKPKPRPRPTPASYSPAPTPAPAAPAAGIVAAGTQVAMNAGSRVCTGSSRPGDKFTATLTSAAVGSNGAVIPSGSKAVIEVASATSGGDGQEAQLLFRVRSIETPAGDVYTVAGDVQPNTALERVRAEENSRRTDTKKVLGGAIAGAILGQAIGKDAKGTIIGAAAGAAAGTVAAKATAKYESCLPAGGMLSLTFSDPVRVTLH